MDWEILTERQRDILAHLADGWLLSEVAKQQSTSTTALRAQMREIYNALALRLGRRNPACAIYKAWFFGEIILPGWLDLPDDFGEISDE